MDDVIGQGREPEPGLRPPLSRRWRVAAGMLAVAVAGLVVAGVGLRQGTGSPGTPESTASTARPGADSGAASVPLMPAPAPQSHPALVICAPSTGACSMRNSPGLTIVRFRRPGAGMSGLGAWTGG